MANYTEITDEQMKRIESCESPAELLEYLKTDGIELDEEQLDMIAGGDGKPDWNDMVEPAYTDQCPYCGSKNVDRGCGIGADCVRVCRDCWQKWAPIRIKKLPSEL